MKSILFVFVFFLPLRVLADGKHSFTINIHSNILFFVDAGNNSDAYFIPVIEEQLEKMAINNVPIFDTVENFNILKSSFGLNTNVAATAGKLFNGLDSFSKNLNAAYEEQENAKKLNRYEYILYVKTNTFNNLIELQFFLLKTSKSDKSLIRINPNSYRPSSIFIDPGKDNYEDKILFGLKQIITEANERPKPGLSVNGKEYYGNDTIYVDANKATALTGFIIDHDSPPDDIKLSWGDIFTSQNKLFHHIDNYDSVQTVSLPNGIYTLKLSANDGISDSLVTFTIICKDKPFIAFGRINNRVKRILQKENLSVRQEKFLNRKFRKKQSSLFNYSFFDYITSGPDELFLINHENKYTYHLDVISSLKRPDSISFYYKKENTNDLNKILDSANSSLFTTNDYCISNKTKVSLTKKENNTPLYIYNYEIKPHDNGYFNRRIPKIDNIIAEADDHNVKNTSLIKINYIKLYRLSVILDVSAFYEFYNNKGRISNTQHYSEIQAGIAYHTRYFTIFSMLCTQSRKDFTDYYINYNFDKFYSAKAGVFANLFSNDNFSLFANANARYAPVYDDNLFVSRVFQSGFGVSSRIKFFNDYRYNYFFNPFINYYNGPTTNKTIGALESIEAGLRFDITFEKGRMN
jgi:hypothetical protein